MSNVRTSNVLCWRFSTSKGSLLKILRRTLDDVHLKNRPDKNPLNIKQRKLNLRNKIRKIKDYGGGEQGRALIGRGSSETAQQSVVGKRPVQMARYRMELDEMELVDKKCR